MLPFIVYSIVVAAEDALPPVNPQNKPVLHQDKNGDAATYFKNRRALVGSGCEVNKLAVVVGVGSWASNLGNLTDENLDNYVSFNKVVGASIGTDPITGVRDMNHHYAAGTKAGFHVLTSSDSQLLSLDVIKAFAITFYCEGELVGTVPIAPEVEVLQLDLISFSAGNVSIDIEAVAPQEFDEILLQPGGGINANVINSIQVQYAYVGDAYKYTLTNQGEKKPNGIEEYQSDYKRNLTLTDSYGGATSDLSNHLTDSNLTNGVSGSLLTLGNLICEVQANVANDSLGGGSSAPFKKGWNVGMHFTSVSLLNLNIGTTMVMSLLDKNGDAIQKEHLNTTILGLGLITGGSADYVITANQDFYGVKFVIATVSIELGAFITHYFYVTPPPEVSHKCAINASASSAVCDYTTSYQLSHNAAVPVVWTVTSQPAGASAYVDDSETVRDMTIEGTYVFTATADDGCEEDVVITRGELQSPSVITDNVLYNFGGEAFQLSGEIHESSGSLISISDINDPENILNAQFDDYAQYTGGLAIADNLMVCGVKTTSGDPIGAMKRVGFVVETKSTGLDLSALNYFQIRGYRNGVKVFGKPIEESNTIALNLIGDSKMQKMRFSVTLDGTEEFDEIQLWKSGVLQLAVSRLNIYYAFANDETTESIISGSTGLGCGLQVVSNKSTGASINSSANNNLQVLGIANVSDNITFLIDDDPELETYLQVANTVSAGGGTYAVRLGRTFGADTQVGIVLDKETYVANVGLGSWLTMETFKDGIDTGDEKNDWSVLDVTALGADSKRLMLMQPTAAFDEVRLTLANVVGALQYPKIYGIVVRSDADRDGIPDCQDSQSCYEELILDEDANRPGSNVNGAYREQGFNHKTRDYSHARLVLHRNITRGATIEDNLWVSLTLPVSLTGLQLRNAFGNQTRLAVADGILTNNTNRINFQYIDLDADKDSDGIPDLDNEYALEAGKYYIIQVVRPPQIGIGETYESLSEATRGGIVDGEVYFVDDVDYDCTQDADPCALQDDVLDINSAYIRFDGTYEATQFGGDGVSTYAFNGGKLYHTSQGSHNMLGFRFWITEGEAAARSGESHAKRMLDFFVTDESGHTTAIIPIADGVFADADSAVYSVSGMYAGKLSEVSAPGVYVTNGHKYVVR